MKKKISKLLIYEHFTLLHALKQMDKIGRKLLIVLDSNDKYVNLLSIGDIQRALLSNNDLTVIIKRAIEDEDKIVVSAEDSFDFVKSVMWSLRSEFIPKISDDNTIEDVVFWEDVFGIKKEINYGKLDLPVVIMAGGKGSRLAPLTNVLPKPLIPIGEKTIVEEIMDRFVTAGCANFYISVNYKADMMKYYFSTLKNSPYIIEYFQEEKPLGTAGSMFLLKDKIKTPFFVSNCDIIIDQNLEEVYKYHKANKNSITIVSVMKHYKIPYGTIETAEHGMLKSLIEKPELTFQINSGMYLLEPELLSEIPENEFFHITDLIDNVKQSGRNVGVFPVSEGSWKDIGEWSEYNKLISNFK